MVKRANAKKTLEPTEMGETETENMIGIKIEEDKGTLKRE